jgi:hypothetical protein
MKLRFITCSFVFAALNLSSHSLSAQDVAAAESKIAEPQQKAVEKRHVSPEKGPAFTEPPKGDLDFALMGEFIGPIATDKENEYESLGLQIRPLGHDNFQAVAYFGGLPGQEAHRPTMTRMVGRRSGDFLILSGGPWAIFVEKDGCLIVDRTGKNRGRLERIARVSPTMHAKAPEGAMVLFDGSNVDQFTNGQMTKDGLLEEGTDFKPMFQDFNMHVEFLLPYMPQADGQQRGNSGLYLQSRYECQVLDSFGTETMINGLGALYQFKKPELNMCFPPLVWQTYDLHFTAPRWAADGTKVRNAHITSWINGVKVQNNVELPNKTGAGKPEEPVLLPTKLQDHGDPVRFRNIWVIDRGLTQVDTFPVLSPNEEPAVEKKAEQPAEKKKANRKNAEPKTNDAETKSEPEADEDKADEVKQPKGE